MRRSVGPALLLAAASACSRDHSALEAETSAGGGGQASSSVGLVVSAGTGGAGGSGGDGTGAQGQGGEAQGGAAQGGGGAGSGGAPPGEPDLPPLLTFVHGVVDRERVAACFATIEGEGTSDRPWPSGGLAFATAVHVDSSTLPERGDVVVVVVAGAERDLASVSCDEILADPEAFPDLELISVGAVPRSALTAPRALVLTAAGCMGGEDHVSRAGELVCGRGYRPDSPTASLIAAAPSRIGNPERVAIQAIGGSIPSAPFDVLIQPGAGAEPVGIAQDLSLGASLPFPPDVESDQTSLGAQAQLLALATLPDEGTTLAEADLGAALDRAGFELEEGGVYAVVFVGPIPTLGAGEWWPALDVAVIDLSP